MVIKKITTETCEDLLVNLKNLNNAELKPYFEFEKEDNNPTFRNKMKFVDGGQIDIPDSFYTAFDNQINFIRDSSGGFEKSDFENAKLLYEILNLTPLEANDERIWIRLTHDQCRKYVIERWFKNGKKSKDVIIDRYFFGGRAQSTRVRNAISRLWWIAHLTIQPQFNDEENRWKFTKAVCDYQEIIVSLFERRLVTYENVRFGFLEFYMENPQFFIQNKGKKIQQLLRDLNNFGGVAILSLMSKESVKELLNRLV
jgi:hypothetical protein